MQLKMDEAEIALAQARAAYNAAESRSVTAKVERCRVAIELAQICKVECAQAAALTEAWQSRAAAEQGVEQAAEAAYAAQASLAGAKSARDSIALQLSQLKNAADCAWNEVHVQLEISLMQHQPIQRGEMLEVVLEHKEPDDAKEEYQQHNPEGQPAQPAIVGDVHLNNDQSQ